MGDKGNISLSDMISITDIAQYEIISNISNIINKQNCYSRL